MGSIEAVATSWLVDPPWQRVFKHTLDVMQDYVCYVLITVGAIALSVKLLTTLSSGDLACVLVGIENAASQGSLKPYVDGNTLGMIAYAQTEEGCIRNVFSHFMEYLPFIMLLETLILVVAEKFMNKIPRIAQKVERFYKNIVEESIFGKDPDVTEDVTDPKTSTEAISRRRQRNEICVSLKRSDIIHHVYIGKNVGECVLALAFLALDVVFAIDPPESKANCRIDIAAFPGLVEEQGAMHFQCKGKKQSFFLLILWTHIALLSVYLLMSLGALIWCWKFRAVTNLLKTIETMRKEWDPYTVSKHSGEDFLFLFDLLAHTCGLEATLRVLTHSDDKFYQICCPKFDSRDSLELEEDRMKVSWKPADIERWLHDRSKNGQIRSHRFIDIDSYEVTIYPAESVKNTKTLPATRHDLITSDGSQFTYETMFSDLLGGKIEYVVTISCVIGKSRMKGEKVVTTLLPYGPEKPVSGMQKSARTNQVEIFWDPPRGDFTKYTLYIDNLKPTLRDAMGPNLNPGKDSYLLRPRPMSVGSSQLSYRDLVGSEAQGSEKVRQVENLSNKLTSYTIFGLEPGELYAVELATKTGQVWTKRPIIDAVLTRPMPPSSLMCTDVSPTSATLSWLRPEGGKHSCLRGFVITVVLVADGKIYRSMAIPRHANRFILNMLSPCIEYEIKVVSVASHTSEAVAPITRQGNMPIKKYESEETKIELLTPPEAVRNLRLDCATQNSIAVKWDPPAQAMPLNQMRYLLSIKMLPMAPSDDDNDEEEDEEQQYAELTKVVKEETVPEKEFISSINISGEKLNHNFAKLPDPRGNGRQYKVKIYVTTKVGLEGRQREAKSSKVTAHFATLPLKPSNLRLDRARHRISWTGSPTTTVTKYRVEWQGTEKGSELHEKFVPQQVNERQEAQLEGLEHSHGQLDVKVFAVSEFRNGDSVESAALAEKFVF